MKHLLDRFICCIIKKGDKHGQVTRVISLAHYLIHKFGALGRRFDASLVTLERTLWILAKFTGFWRPFWSPWWVPTHRFMQSQPIFPLLSFLFLPPGEKGLGDWQSFPPFFLSHFLPVTKMGGKKEAKAFFPSTVIWYD